MAPVVAEPLERLFAGLPAQIRGNPQTPISSIVADSRQVRPGALFFCLRGARADGHDFAAAAIAAGAAAIVAEREIATGADVAVAVVSDPLAALSKIAARFFGDPSQHMRVVGVTGTNGKTTTTYFLEAIARAAGDQFGVMGTLGARLG